MIVIIGLVVLIAAVLIGIAGVFANGGTNHALTDNFSLFGYHVTGSTGVLFLYGIAVGGIGIAGLALLLAGARRTARRGRAARQDLRDRDLRDAEYGRRTVPARADTRTTEVVTDTSGGAAEPVSRRHAVPSHRDR
ncbi:hypothetical protein [Nocardia sp. alder85J]|uniref:hypothetical protein n=1 Tax=Nocardia sp. alder85J TaxID=2862949 RepID=UPI001CD500DB|nr:hypothetical protein [Nocardia sp. alder85J]MCX4096734.1 hypothetical protein [Nocardia sp. alder85J]